MIRDRKTLCQSSFNSRSCDQAILAVRISRHKVMRLQCMCPITTGFSEAHWMVRQLQGTDTMMYGFTGRLSDDGPRLTRATPQKWLATLEKVYRGHSLNLQGISALLSTEIPVYSVLTAPLP
jgi:hypothetical protein